MFIYWGWDCALSVNEETKDSARTPGRAAVMATVMLVAIFAVVSVASLAYAGPAFLAAHSTDVLGAMATSVLGSTPGKLLVLCVLTSTAASARPRSCPPRAPRWPWPRTARCPAGSPGCTPATARPPWPRWSWARCRRCSTCC